MKQNAIKTFAILVLVAINLLLAISLSSQTRQIKYYDESLIYSTAENMKKNGMIIDSSIIPRTRESYSVLEGVYDTDVILSVAKRCFKTGVLSVYALPTGAVHITDGSRGYARFYQSLNFEFCSEEFVDMLALLKEETATAVNNNGQFDITVSDFLSVYGGNTDINGFAVTTDSISYYKAFDAYEIKCQQITEGLPVYGFIVTVYLRGGSVCAAEGKWCFNAPKSRINAETQDIISILINESGRLRTEYKAALKENADALMPAYIVSGINANYYIYSDDDGNIYFVPVYVISYYDRSGSVYNTVTGKMISVTGDNSAGTEQLPTT